MINDPPRAHSTYVNNHPICMFISPLSWESSRSVEFHWKFRRNFSLVWHNNSNGRSSTAVPSIAAVPLSAVASCPRHGPPMSPPNEPYTHTRPLECSFPILHAAKSPRWDFSVPRQKKFNSDENDFRSLSALIVSLIIMNRERFDQNLNVGRHFHRPLQRLTKAICFNLSRSFLAHESVVNWNEIGHFHLPSAR